MTNKEKMHLLKNLSFSLGRGYFKTELIAPIKNGLSELTEHKAEKQIETMFKFLLGKERQNAWFFNSVLMNLADNLANDDKTADDFVAILDAEVNYAKRTLKNNVIL